MATGEYHITGGGDNMWGTKDAFHCVWKKMSGDFMLTADVRILGAGGKPHRKGCLLVRQSLAPEAAYADVALHGDGLAALQWRDEAGFDYDFPPNHFDPWKHIPSVTWKKNGQPAWMLRHFTLRLRCPTNFTGAVHLQYRDTDSGKAVAAVESGRDACYIGPHDGDGKWVALRITPADLIDGAVEITVFKPAGGDSWSRALRVTRLVVCKAP